MEHDRPHYRVYGYYGDNFSFEWTEFVDGACDSRMIEEARELLKPDPENMPATYCWTDLFYCHGRFVRAVGTWVVRPGIENQSSATWHADGWSERPRPSKEKSLRYLHELGRPI
jgi:hypothetical protein